MSDPTIVHRDDRWRAAFECAPDGLALLAPDTAFAEVNGALCALLGRSREDLLAGSLRSVTHRRDLEAVNESLAAALLGQDERVEVVARLIDAGGAPVTVRLAARLARDADGRPSFFHLHVQELAGEAGRLLRRAAIFDAALDPIWTVDADLRISDANDAVCRLLGRSREELVGTPVTDLVAPEGGEDEGGGPLERWARLVQAGGGRAQRRLLRADGSPVDVDIAIRTDYFPGEHVAILRDVSARVAAEAALRHRALHDPLTGLPNRTLFVDRLSHALAGAERRGARVAVVMLDVDQFKVVNDSLGHDAGDRLLETLAPRLRGAVRGGDTVARFGGDEFVVLCEDLDGEAEANEVADRIKEAFEDPFVLDDAPHVVTASIGVAVSVPGARCEPGELLRDADAAMYRAKSRGRNRVELFDDELRQRSVARLEIERDLRRALERSELHVVYQPIVSLPDAAVVGFEALARWDHPERGAIPPNEFVPVAEESGLIVPIGEWVLRAACEQAARFASFRHGRRRLGMHVNLSARQVADPHLVARVSEIVAAAGIVPGQLVLEITESCLMENAEAPLEALLALQRLGVRLVLDDFGTGYSSLSYLERFPIDGLKVDRSFIAELDQTDDSPIVSAIVRMAWALGLSVTAEGIETAEQLERVQALRCTRGQGYAFARPLPADEAARLLDGPPPWAALGATSAP